MKAHEVKITLNRDWMALNAYRIALEAIADSDEESRECSCEQMRAMARAVLEQFSGELPGEGAAAVIARTPSLVFAALWLAWYGCVLAALFRPDDPTFGLWVLLAFLPVEAVAVFVDTGKRDTLSEIQTWWNKTLGKDGVAIWRGWNALLLVFVFLVCALLWRVVAHYSGSDLIAWAIAAGTAVWLADHWREPSVYG